jgi:hypothetical protein
MKLLVLSPGLGDPVVDIACCPRPLSFLRPLKASCSGIGAPHTDGRAFASEKVFDAGYENLFIFERYHPFICLSITDFCGAELGGVMQRNDTRPHAADSPTTQTGAQSGKLRHTTSDRMKAGRYRYSDQSRRLLQSVHVGP